MRLLVLGGTQFLGRAIVEHAAAQGHHVTCAARGVAGPAPPLSRFIPIDRDEPDGLAALAGEPFDAAVDLSRHPGQVRRAAASLQESVGHWTFVSTTSVYADIVSPGQTADTAPLLAPTGPEVERSGRNDYGPAKVACEQAFGDTAFICRPGLIVGPGDPTGRFSYWAVRLNRGGDVLVPEKPDDPVQYIDVRDLARWIVHAAHARLVGRFDAVGPSRTRRDFLHECTTALGSSCTFAWVDQVFMDRYDVRSGSGPRSLPYPMPDTVADNTRDVSASLRAGLSVRPLAETVRDTVLWLDAGGGPITGLTAEEEASLLAIRRAEFP
jgi:nucleoside-diphosphate-sugar epimerase